MLPERFLNWLTVNKFGIFLSGIIVILLGLAWTLVGITNSRVKYGNITLNGNISRQDLSQKLSKQASSYKLNFKFPDSSIKSYDLASVGITFDANKTHQLLSDQRHGLKQIIIWWKPIKGQVSYKIDSSKLSHFIANDISQTISAPQDATIGFNGGDIVIGDSKEGLRVYLDSPSATILSHAGRFDNSPLVLSKRVVKPSLTAKDFEQYKGQINQITSQKIVLRIDNSVITPTSSDIASWLDLATYQKTKKLNIAVNSGKVQAYIDRTTTRYTKTVKSQVEVTSADGSKLVLVQGQNGVAITNKSQVSSEISSALLNGKGLEKTLTTKSTPFQVVNGAGSGKWIEVDVSSKRLYAYDNGVLVNSFPVSAGAPATPTVLGTDTQYMPNIRCKICVAVMLMAVVIFSLMCAG
jgi:hypothetical protein